MRISGRNLYVHSVTAKESMVISQGISFSAGLGTHDQEIALPYFLIRERLMTAMVEMILIGSGKPDYGLVNVFGDDGNLTEEILKTFKEIGLEHGLSFDISRTKAYGLSTSFSLTLTSITMTSELKLNRVKEGQYVYYVGFEEPETPMVGETRFLPISLMEELAHSSSVGEAVFLKDQSIKEGIGHLLKHTDCVFVETSGGVDTSLRCKRGGGVVFVSNHKVMRFDEPGLYIAEAGMIYNK